MKALIAGIDPGTNTAVVIIDEDENIVDKFSGKNISNEDIIKYINNINNVVLISTDKKEIPKSILEISSKLNIGVYAPKKDIDMKTKSYYYRDEKLKKIFENTHEFDAYISAIEALKKLKDIFDKAKKVAKDEKEYIKILRLTFKNRKIEPFSAKENLKEKEEEKIIKVKRKKKKKEKKIENVKIVIEKKIEEKDNEIKEINEKYIKLLDDYNKISLILLKKINDNDNIIPKASFLYLNKENSKKVFLDDTNEEIIKYVINRNMKLFILEKDKEKIKDYAKEYYILEDFIDLKNFIIVKSYKKEENKEKEKFTIDELKKILKDYRTHHFLNKNL